MHFVKYIVLFALAVVSAFASSDWVNFSNPYPIRSAIRFGNGVLAATDGGMLYCSTDGNRIYSATDGLETTAFFSVTMNNEGAVYAVSEYGIVASLSKDYRRWTVLNRSFTSSGVRALPDQIAISGNILTVGFENRLSFFDVETKTYFLTLTRLGSDLLSINSIQNMTVHGDTLFVALKDGIYVRKIDWSNIQEDSKLVDPESWHKLSTPEKDRLFPAKLGPLVVGKKDTIDVRWKISLNETETLFVSAYEVYLFNGEKYSRLDEKLAVGEFYNILPLSYGGVLMISVDDQLVHSSGEKFDESIDFWFGTGNVTEPYTQRVKTLAATAKGDVFFHVWGHGFKLYSEWGQKQEYSFKPNSRYCMDEIVDNFVIATSTIVAPDSSGFLTATSSENGYSLVYVSLDGEMSCLGGYGSAHIAGPMEAMWSNDKSEWIVYVGSRASTSIDASGSLDVFHITPPSKTGGRLVANNYKSYSSIDNNTPVDMKLDVKRDVLWLVTNSALGYFELNQDTVKQPKSTKGLQEATYTSIDVDVQGNVWVGTTNRGAYRLQRYGSSFDSLTATNFTTRNGMLSNEVSDLAIDPVLGMAWFTHVQGVSRYFRKDLRDASSFMTDSALVGVKAYPNPFRPKIHAHVTIDNIAENSTVSIFNRGGSLVQFFEGKDVLGGRVEWDGIGRNGKVVTPGVYYYVVKNSSEIKKGKIIVIR